jgi:hypothetical protein
MTAPGVITDEVLDALCHQAFNLAETLDGDEARYPLVIGAYLLLGLVVDPLPPGVERSAEETARKGLDLVVAWVDRCEAGAS